MSDVNSIYSLRGVFTDLLEDAGKSQFMIPAYQRGYKWGSSGGNSQVEVLMRDLKTAFTLGRTRYFLQFITLKENGQQLEVIDGQQRLTTLTILFTILNGWQDSVVENFVTDKLDYQVRQNFVRRFLYENSDLIDVSSSWNEFISQNDTQGDLDNQDVFFIYSAYKSIEAFLGELPLNEIEAFRTYLEDNVFLIVNYLDSDFNSEQIFINVNKGVRLRDEELVKGILITEIPIDNERNRAFRQSEIEINEARANVGRQWDEISQWCLRPDITAFFRVENYWKGINWLVRLAFPEAMNVVGEHALFEYVDNLHRTKTLTASDIFKRIGETMLILNDWFSDNQTHNLLGVVLHAKPSSNIDSIWSSLKGLTTKQSIISKLKKRCETLLPFNESGALIDLTYEEHKEQMFNVFLLLDLFKALPIDNNSTSRYDFEPISTGQWTLEHMYPQNIKDFKGVSMLAIDDLIMLKEIIGGEFGNLDFVQEENRQALESLVLKIMTSEKQCELLVEEQVALEQLLKVKGGILHSIGNMALLESKMNTSLSNHFFDKKRKIIVRKISEGKFVPLHTYDVFSKLVIDSRTSLHIWTVEDVEEHADYIKIQMTKVYNYLNSDI